MNQLVMPQAGFETQVLPLKKRLAKVHRIITAGGLWPVTKGHVSCRVPGTNHVLILGHIHSEGRNLSEYRRRRHRHRGHRGQFYRGAHRGRRRALCAHRGLQGPARTCTRSYTPIPTMATAFGIAGRQHPAGWQSRRDFCPPTCRSSNSTSRSIRRSAAGWSRRRSARGCAVVLKNHGVVVDVGYHRERLHFALFPGGNGAAARGTRRNWARSSRFPMPKCAAS